MMTRSGTVSDAAEGYLRTLYELGEEGILPLRARLAERAGHSGPAVGQTVARMERHGLLRVSGDRQLLLTGAGRRAATAVMRKHRLAERLLTDVLGLAWEDVHTEASRLQHVISESAERRIAALLGPPFVSPYGNPIPGLAELGVAGAGDSDSDSDGEAGRPLPTLLALAEGGRPGPVTATVARIGERLQADRAALGAAARAGLLPGRPVQVAADGRAGGIGVRAGAGWLTIDRATAGHLFAAAERPRPGGPVRPPALRLR